MLLGHVSGCQIGGGKKNIVVAELQWIMAVTASIYYLNGLLYTTIATVFNWSNLRLDGTAYLYIPTGYGENYHMDGSVSNINLYNRELSSTEIFQNFNSQKSRFGL